MSDAHDSRHRLGQVWVGVLAGVVATLVLTVTVYSLTAPSIAQLLRGAGAPESVAPQ